MTPNSKQLHKAAKVKERIEALEQTLREILCCAEKCNATTATAAAPRKKGRGGMSPEGKARVAEAQRKRWAKIKQEKRKA